MGSFQALNQVTGMQRIWKWNGYESAPDWQQPLSISFLVSMRFGSSSQYENLQMLRSFVGDGTYSICRELMHIVLYILSHC